MTSRRLIQRGLWLYDGSTPMPATIIALDYDFWYEIGRADRDLESDEVPALNADGLLYYVCFKSDPEAHPGWVDSQGFGDVGAARAWAEAQVPGPIQWSEPSAI